MREDLLGYLLGALEPEEMQRVGRAVRDTPALAAELDRLQAALRPLEEADEQFEPPGDLVSRTLGAIDRYEAEHSSDEIVAGRSSGAAGDRFGRASGRLTPTGVARTAPPWRWVDCLATTVAAMIMAGLVLPSILRARSVARQAGCRETLRETGTSIIQYALMASDRRLPQVAIRGPQAFAGNYAVELGELALLRKPTPLWCPSRDLPAECEGQLIPSVAEVRTASPRRRARLQRIAGGHYAYCLGVLERGIHVAPRYEGRAGFAILADAPFEAIAGWLTAHEGRGVNVLFEDGRVCFLVHGAMDALDDHPFLNDRGAVEAGVDPHDATLGPSWCAPFETRDWEGWR